MTTDWWSTHSETAPTEAASPPAPQLPEPQRPEPTQQQSPEPPETPPPDAEHGGPRRKAALLVGGSVAVLLVGLLATQGPGGDEGGTGKAGSSVSSAQQGGLPAAGAGPGEAASPQAVQGNPASVTLTATPTGRGRVGAVMKVSIRNNTGNALTVLASLVSGDGRSALVGVGTLAPGARTVQPGARAEGTVEFSARTPPRQIVLLDLSGNVVATSE